MNGIDILAYSIAVFIPLIVLIVFVAYCKECENHYFTSEELELWLSYEPTKESK